MACWLYCSEKVQAKPPAGHRNTRYSLFCHLPAPLRGTTKREAGEAMPPAKNMLAHNVHLLESQAFTLGSFFITPSYLQIVVPHEYKTIVF